MLEHKKVSIIVPIYNSVKYLDQCVESILGQKYQNIELILVDDGSTDGSSAKCDTWVKNDSRVIVLHRENAGSAASRNAGLAIASGEYIGFVDSDDMVKADMFIELVAAQEKTDSDITMCSYEEIIGTQEPTPVNEFEIKEYSGRDMAKLIISNEKPKISYSIWKCIFNKQLIENIRFVDGVHYCEDGVFLLESLWKAKKVTLVDAELYCYRIHGNSISARISEKRIRDIIFKSDWLLDKYNLEGNEEEMRVVREAILDELISYRRICYPTDDAKHVVKIIDTYLRGKNFSVKDAKRDIKHIIKYYVYRYGVSMAIIRKLVSMGKEKI